MPAVISATVDDTGIELVDFVGTRTFLWSSLTPAQKATTTTVENRLTVWASGLASLPYGIAFKCVSLAPIKVKVALGETNAEAAAFLAARPNYGG